MRHPDTVAVRDVVAKIRLTRSNPHRALIPRIDRDGSDGADGIVRPDVVPGKSAVGRLPNSAVRAAEVVEIRIGIRAGYAGNSSTRDRGPDVSPLQRIEARSGQADGEQEWQRRQLSRAPIVAR
jgi:hypothetical protein